MHRLGAELDDLHLTTSEINALANLLEPQARTVAELAAATGSRPTTLTNVLDRLERYGYVRRVPHPRDRRSTVLELTARGRDTAQTIRRATARLERRALRHLPPATVAQFHAVLDALMAVSS